MSVQAGPGSNPNDENAAFASVDQALTDAVNSSSLQNYINSNLLSVNASLVLVTVASITSDIANMVVVINSPPSAMPTVIPGNDNKPGFSIDFSNTYVLASIGALIAVCGCVFGALLFWCGGASVQKASKYGHGNAFSRSASNGNSTTATQEPLPIADGDLSLVPGVTSVVEGSSNI